VIGGSVYVDVARPMVIREYAEMTTFVLIHGGGDVGWYWHLLQAELRSRGHDSVAPDLPCDDDSASLNDYADTVVEAIGDRRGLVVVGQSYGGFTAPLVADRLPVDGLVLLAGMIPSPGEAPADWWDNTGYGDAVREQAKLDGGKTGNDDPFVCYFDGVPRALAEEAMSKTRGESSTAYSSPWPLDAWPDVPTRFVLCKDDRFFPADFFRRLAPERLGVAPDEIPGCHAVALSHPKELADLLVSYTARDA
jgi:pimeloyl-ACP methyl ester carboxylesterase